MRRATIAVWLLVTAALVNPVHADPLADGVDAYKRKDYDKSVALLEPLARNGNARAQLWIGQMYYYGHGVQESDAVAFDWFSRAANQGNAEAQLQLANMLVYRRGAPAGEADPDVEAAKWYFSAARQGHPEAQYSLALLFAVGKGVQQNDAEAQKWMKRAAAHGHPDAKAFLTAYTRRR